MIGRPVGAGVTVAPLPPHVRAIQNRAAILWGGFSHRWEREFVVETPHRMGSFASYVDEESHTLTPGNEWRARALAHFEFSPGQNSDYARPHMRIGMVTSPAISVGRDIASFSFEDVGSGDRDTPSAYTLKRSYAVISLDQREHDYGAHDQYVVVLRGWDLITACLDDAYGGKCSSDAMWPYRLHVGVETCTRIENALWCSFKLEIGRAWTPHRGGGFGRTFNHRMRFDARIHYTVIGGGDGAFRATPGPELVAEGTIKGPAITADRVLSGQSGYSRAQSSIQAFEFELLPTPGDNGRLGRYMDALEVLYLDESYSMSTGDLTSRWVANFDATNTVVDANVRYKLRPILLQFDHRAHTLRNTAEGAGITGQVCLSGVGLSCSNLGIPEGTTDVVSIDRLVSLTPGASQ